jgi:hypothetical protein
MIELNIWDLFKIAAQKLMEKYQKNNDYTVEIQEANDDVTVLVKHTGGHMIIKFDPGKITFKDIQSDKTKESTSTMTRNGPYSYLRIDDIGVSRLCLIDMWALYDAEDEWNKASIDESPKAVFSHVDTPIP